MSNGLVLKVEWEKVPYVIEFGSYDELRTWLVDESVSVFDRLEASRHKRGKKGGLFGRKMVKDEQIVAKKQDVNEVDLTKQDETQPVLEDAGASEPEIVVPNTATEPLTEMFECPVCGKKVAPALAKLHLDTRHPDAY